MKNKRAFPLAAIALSIVVIIVLVVSLALSVGVSLLTSKPTSAPLAANTPVKTNVPSASKTPDPCLPGNVQATTQDFNKLIRQFDDIARVAQNTPGNQLAPMLTQLQDVRRNSEDYAAPACLQILKAAALNYMNTYINTLLTLYAAYPALSSTQTPQDVVKQDVAVINQGMTQAGSYHQQYQDELARLLGTTPTPPTDTPAPLMILPTVTP
jgi:hypothetical protein